MYAAITGVFQQVESSTFNRKVRGSIPLIGITEWDTAHGAKTKQTWDFKCHCLYGKAFRSIILVVKNIRLIFLK